VLSIERCIELLGTDAPADRAAIEQVRAALYELAKVTKSVFLENGNIPTAVEPSPFESAFSLLAEDDRAEIEERAAIFEFDGHLTRDQAERFALHTHCHRPRAQRRGD
jgi:hypothetical protein